jgi:SAM-dependent methyltransferase
MSEPTLNYWDGMQTGQDFLAHLRHSSRARRFCRNTIRQMVDRAEASSILEVGFGGLNEVIAMQPLLDRHPEVRYSGIDWTQTFVTEARARFPRHHWQRLDITQCDSFDVLASDIVYSQHVLEHCPGLNPALSNMLRLARKALFNIFFIPPVEVERIDHSWYPLYHNYYARSHIAKVCEHQGFTPLLLPFDNADQPDARECQQEVVLVAIRQGD